MAPSSSCISITPIINFFSRRAFSSAGLRPQTVSLEEDEGGSTTIRLWISRRRPDPTARALVLLHGFGPDATWQWYNQVRPLSRRFHLVVPDLLFFGGSSTLSPHRSEAFQARCVVRALDRAGIGRFSVVGTSYGGFVAYHVARICGVERVGRVVIASSDVGKRRSDDAALVERAMGIGGLGEVSDLLLPRSTRICRKMMELCCHRRPTWIPDFVLRDVAQTLQVNREEKIELLKGVSLDKYDPLPRLSQEVLILWGEHDQIFLLEKAYQLQKQIGDNVKLEVMRDTSHVPQAEDPKRFNQILINFLLEYP